jgi:hypothetical protein
MAGEGPWRHLLVNKTRPGSTGVAFALAGFKPLAGACARTT